MKKVQITDESGKKTDAFIPESNEELQKQITNDRRQTLKEHLYMTYLLIGTVAFTLGIWISVKRLNGK
jgi:hypothetical protein